MRLPLPGPIDLLPTALTASFTDASDAARRSVNAGAAALRDGLDAAETALELVPRVEALLTRVETVVAGAERVLARVDEVADAARAAVQRVDAIAEAAQSAVIRVDAVADAAQSAVTRVDRIAEGARAAVGRVDPLITGIDATRSRADGLVAEVSNTREQADGLVLAVSGTVRRAETIATDVDSTRQRADQVAAAVDGTRQRADEVAVRAGAAVTEASGLVARTDGLLGAYQPTLEALAPMASRLVSSLEGHEVEAAVALVDRLPTLLQHLDEDILPILQAMEQVGPEVHELLEAVEDVRRVLTGLPGAKLFRRRGEDDQ